jgi:hypothetical protein
MADTPDDVRRSWPFFNTPLRLFLAVVAPVCALMLPLALVAPRGWMRATAAAVVLCSTYGAVRGYFCRLTIDVRGVTWRGLWRTIRLPWEQVRRIDRYAPGVGGAEYVYVTTRDEPPAGRWDVDESTIQMQDRPGLLDALRSAWRRGA